MQDEHETRDEANDAAPSQPISKPKAGEADQHDHEKLPPPEAPKTLEAHDVEPLELEPEDD